MGCFRNLTSLSRLQITRVSPSFPSCSCRARCVRIAPYYDGLNSTLPVIFDRRGRVTSVRLRLVFFPSLPLLDGCFSDVKHGGKDGLTNVIFRPDFSDIFSLELVASCDVRFSMIAGLPRGFLRHPGSMPGLSFIRLKSVFSSASVLNLPVPSPVHTLRHGPDHSGGSASIMPVARRRHCFPAPSMRQAPAPAVHVRRRS